MLTRRLSGSDLTSLLLDVMKDRADELSASDVLRQYCSDRFVQPSSADAVALARLSAEMLSAAVSVFDAVELPPVVPLGTHSAIAGVDLNRVITTTRRTEVQADPTNALALEAAVRRRAMLAESPRSSEMVRLSAIERVVRAQRFDGPRSFAHFSLLGLVIAGRDVGSHRFEIDSLIELVTTLADLVRQACGAQAHIELSDLSGHLRDGGTAGPTSGLAAASNEILAALEASATVASCQMDLGRKQGKGYYSNLCFKIWVDHDGERVEVGDGGVVPWTVRLLQNQKERLTIGAISLERLLLVGHGAQ